MAKYAHLRAERDEAIARAVEAERLSNVAVVRDLEERLARAESERDALRGLLASMERESLRVKEHIVAANQLLGRAVALGVLADGC